MRRGRPAGGLGLWPADNISTGRDPRRRARVGPARRPPGAQARDGRRRRAPAPTLCDGAAPRCWDTCSQLLVR
jgi:hypothetical protein